MSSPEVAARSAEPGPFETSSAESRPWLPALLWLAALGPLFFLSYGFANWVTGLRRAVPEVAFAWEHRIPFLAWTIIPYWSTDLFYAVSVFLCRTRAELRTHVSRLIAVQVLCVAGFLLAPLRFGFERPAAEGLFGQLFDALMSFDKPFNQAPSLHIALIAVLWARYARHFSGVTMWLLRLWFVLMAVSTLTTYQHHFIDLPAGLWVGLVAMALFPEQEIAPRHARSGDQQRFPLGMAYVTAGLLCAYAAHRIGGGGWILAWLAAALVLVAGIYWSGQPWLFGKSGGRMAPAAMSLLAPYIALAWLSSRWFTRGQMPANEIVEGVWLGRFPTPGELTARGMASVVDVTAELPFTGRGVEYRSVPMLDLMAPGADQLDAAVDAIEAFAAARPTLVCCALGYSRSATAMAAWLIATGRAASVDEAIAQVRIRRPVILLGAAHRQALAVWAKGEGLAVTLEFDGKVTASFLRSGQVVSNASNCAAVIAGVGLLLGRPGAGRVWFAASAVLWLVAVYLGLRVSIDAGLFRDLAEKPEDGGRSLDEWLRARGVGQPARERSMEERSRGALRLWIRLIVVAAVQFAALAAGLVLQAWRPDAG